MEQMKLKIDNKTPFEVVHIGAVVEEQIANWNA